MNSKFGNWVPISEVTNIFGTQLLGPGGVEPTKLQNESEIKISHKLKKKLGVQNEREYEILKFGI